MKTFIRNGMAALLLSTLACIAAPSATQAQDPFLGEMRYFAGDYAPRGWAFCDGQLLNISRYSSLYSLLGCTYGGDCRTTFALPDVRSRTTIGTGSNTFLGSFPLGQKGGGFDQVGQQTGNFAPVRTPKFMGVNCIIAIYGVFPSRN